MSQVGVAAPGAAAPEEPTTPEKRQLQKESDSEGLGLARQTSLSSTSSEAARASNRASLDPLESVINRCESEIQDECNSVGVGRGFSRQVSGASSTDERVGTKLSCSATPFSQMEEMESRARYDPLAAVIARCENEVQEKVDAVKRLHAV